MAEFNFSNDRLRGAVSSKITLFEQIEKMINAIIATMPEQILEKAYAGHDPKAIERLEILKKCREALWTEIISDLEKFRQ